MSTPTPFFADYKKITAKFIGKCSLCEETHLVGAKVYWNKKKPKGRKILCIACYYGNGSAPEPTPKPIPEPTPEPTPEPPPPAKPTPDMPRIFLQTWTSFDAFVDYVATTPSYKHWSKRGRARRDGKDEFNDFTGWSESLVLARSGWPAGLKDVSGEVAKILGSKHSNKRVDGFDVGGVGLFPEVGAVLTGSPMCHVTIADGHEMVSKVVRLTVDLCTNAYTTSYMMKLYGAALCILIQTMERSGDSVEVVGAFDVESIKHIGYTLCQRIRLKDAGQPLDMDRLAFMLGHPASLRRLALHAIETTEWSYLAGFESGHGRATFVPSPADGIVIRGCYHHEIETTLKKVENQYNEQTVGG